MTEYIGNDIYCDEIISGKLPVEMLEETENVLAFKHTRPHWPVHIVVVPKKHVPSLLELQEYPELANNLLEVITKISKQINSENHACRVLTNLGDYQDSKHLHFHISSGSQLKSSKSVH